MSKSKKAKNTDETTAPPTTPSGEIAVEKNQLEIDKIDDILESKLSGDINGYRNLLTDTTVMGTWAQRQTALVQLERQVIPADIDNKADVEAAEFIKTQLENQNFDKILKAMQWGVYYGYSVGELMWNLQDGKVGIADILVRDRGKFKFDKEKQLVFLGNSAETVMPDGKFWTFNAGGDTTDNPYGLGLAHFLFWAVLFKKSNIKFWLLGLEKAATSTVHVQYDPRAKDPESEKQKALKAGVAIKNGSATATALGTVVELLKGESGTASYETLCRYMDEAIALVVLGQVMTSQAVGGQYKGEIQNEVKEDIIKADADLLCSSFNDTVIKWLTQWNFPNATPPKLWLLTKDEADEKKQTEAWKNMVAVGYRPTLDTVEETLGGKWEEMPNQNQPTTDQSNNQDNADDKANDKADDAKTKDDKPSTDFAESDNPTHDHKPRLIDGIANQLEDELAPVQNAWLADIEQELATVDSLEAFRDKLNELAEKLTFEQYAQVFAQANISAKLAGMQSVEDEAADDE